MISTLAAWVGMTCSAADDPHRARRMRRNAWERLAYVARYGNVPPSEAGQWEIADLIDFANAIAEIVRAENKPTKG